jgi:hypothetical protein
MVESLQGGRKGLYVKHGKAGEILLTRSAEEEVYVHIAG